jgi:hypothetical protein
LVPNKSTSIQTKFAAEEYLTEGHSNFSDISCRNSKTNSFQKIRAEFIAKINLNKESASVNTSSHVSCAILTAPRQENNCNGYGEITIETKD